MTKRTQTLSILWLNLACLCLFAGPAFSAAAAPPDLTQGGKPDATHDWTLGPTGARGWIFTANGHSRDSRQILITVVAKGSPADGILSAGDVILGVGDNPFGSDARVSFAQGIAGAEAKDGVLRLLRWRGGETGPVEMKLPVLGEYSSTAPHQCPKSRLVFEQGCESLARRMAAPGYERRVNGITRPLNALALLSSDREEYLPLVRKEAQWAAEFRSDGYLSWFYGYVMMFLAEYVMATGDQSVMPGLERLALETARGASSVGTWGHRFAVPGGNLGGYGAMNAPGLSLTIGMTLAREAGVKNADLDNAIAKAAAFLRWYAGKGAVPYGDHQPFPAHEDNGKCSAAAILFDLLEDREAAEFFGKMSTAAYSERERGHTGNYFNMQWALLGVARCGPLATGAYLKEQAWYYDLARGWDGEFLYQGSPAGEEESRAYRNWDCSGGYLLAYALPLKKLRLTGKKTFVTEPLDAGQVAEVIAAGRDFAYKGDPNRYEDRGTPELLAGLSSWSPFVRKRSAEALGKRSDDLLPELLQLIAGENRDARYGAVEALGALGSRADAAAPQLRALLHDSDPWLQALAAEAIPRLGPDVRKASIGDLLAMTVRENPADPRRLASRSASVALFSPYPGRREPRSILSESLEGVDRSQLYPALRALLQHEDSVPRSAASKTFSRLSDRDIAELLPDIVKAVERIAPSNEMFGDGVRIAGLDLLSRLHVREGIDLCLAVMEPERWGEKNRTQNCLRFLQRYGTHAQAALPKLRETRAWLEKVKRASADHLKEFDKALADIESSTQSPTLVGIAEFQSGARR